MPQQQSEAAQQLGLWAIDSLAQPTISPKQVPLLIGNPAVSITANRMVKAFAAACMRRKL